MRELAEYERKFLETEFFGADSGPLCQPWVRQLIAENY